MQQVLTVHIVRVKVDFEVEIFSENVIITHQYTRCQNHDHVFVNLKISNFWQKIISTSEQNSEAIDL